MVGDKKEEIVKDIAKWWACYPHQNNFTKIKNTLTELLWLGSAVLYAELAFFTNIYYISLVMILSIQNNVDDKMNNMLVDLA